MKIEDLLVVQTKQLDEGGFSRLIQHINNRYLGIISASRDNVFHEVNDQNTEILKKDIKLSGFGYLSVIGRYIEKLGEPDEKKVIERSFLIIGKDRDDSGNMIGFLKKEGQRFNQESILYKPIDKKNAFLIYMDGRPTKDIGVFHPRQIGDYYTAVKGKTFTFASLNEELGIFDKQYNTFQLEKSQNNQK